MRRWAWWCLVALLMAGLIGACQQPGGGNAGLKAPASADDEAGLLYFEPEISALLAGWHTCSRLALMSELGDR